MSDAAGLASLKALLEAAHAALRAHADAATRASAPSVVVVMGNESCDADSMFSALLMAHGLRRQQEEGEAKAGPAAASSSSSKPVPVPVPVFNCTAAELPLRTEAAPLLASLGSLGGTPFVFWPDVEELLQRAAGGTGAAAGAVEVLLVDHNRVASSQEFIEPLVTRIVDHHVDEGRSAGAKERQVCLVGSCASLVACAAGFVEPAPSSRATAALTPLWAKLLAAAVLLDTAAFDTATRKGTMTDLRVAKAACGVLGWSLELDLDDASAEAGAAAAQQQEEEEGAACDTRPAAGELRAPEARAFHDELARQRFDVSGLNSEQVLMQDYKQWTMAGRAVGIASARRELSVWTQHGDETPASVATAFDDYASSRGLDVLLVMGAFSSKATGAFTRELTVVVRDEALLAALRDHLNSDDAGLQLTPTCPELAAAAADGHILPYTQANLGASRKQIQPLVAKFFDAYGTGTGGSCD